MKHSRYKYKFYLNADHSILIDGKMGQIHPHTWELQLDVLKVVDEFVQFSIVEQTVETILNDYQDKYLNEIRPFDVINPTLENIGEFFHLKIGEELKVRGWMVLRLEISETPTRSYIVDVFDEEEDV